MHDGDHLDLLVVLHVLLQDGVCSRLMVEPDQRPNPWTPLLWMPVRFALLVAVAVAVVLFALRPPLAALGLQLPHLAIPPINLP